GEAQRTVADRSLREAVGRLVGQWSRADPNPDAYREVLQHASRGASPNGARAPNAPAADAPGACEPERVIQMALEMGVLGMALWRSVDRVSQEGRVGRLLELLDGAPDRATADAVLKHLSSGDTLRRLLASERVDF